MEQNNVYNSINLNEKTSWGFPENSTGVRTRVNTFNCPSSPADPARLDGIPEISPFSPTVCAISDYSPTIGVDRRLVSAGLVDGDGKGILVKNDKPRFADITDGLSNTILYAESAGRPFVYRKGGKLLGNDLTKIRTNAGGWCRPATDFSVDGANEGGTAPVGPCAINCANGDEVGSAGFPIPYYNTEGTSETFAFHPGGANILMGDGSVRFIKESIGIRLFAKLVTRAGGEIVSADQY